MEAASRDITSLEAGVATDIGVEEDRVWLDGTSSIEE